MLKEIINVIIPDNIKDIKLVKDSLDIFVDYIIENSNISIDVKNVLDENKKDLYTELVKVYLRNIYDVLSSSKHNENLYNKLKELYKALNLNIDEIDLSIDITKLLTKEYLISNKDYEESKGTPKAMKYIYDMVIRSGVQKDLENGYNISEFGFEEGPNVFEYNVYGNLIPAVYEQFVKPLTHPVGWAYFYRRIFYDGCADYFRIKFEYNIYELSIKCMYGNNVESDDYLNNVSHFKHHFDEDPNYSNVIETKKTELENENATLDKNSEKYKSNERLINLYNKCLNGDFTLVSDSTVEFISTADITLSNSVIIKKTIHFINGEKLEAIENNGVILYGINNEILIDYSKDFKGSCGLFTDYDEKLTTLVTDEINLVTDEPLASTTGKLNVVGAGNVFVGSTISGDNLVNKDVPVTYQSVIGKPDNTSVTKIHSLADYETTQYWRDKRFKKTYPAYYWDSGLHFGDFRFIYASDEEYELLLKSYNNIKQKTYGATARDEYAFRQIPVHEAQVNFDFEDNFTNAIYWDSGNYFDDSFNFDTSIIVHDEFDIKIV